MKRLAVLLLLCLSCGRETRDDSARTMTLPSNPPPRKITSTAREIGGIIPRPGTSTPSRCAGDGSYAMALDCFRISSGFHFSLGDINGTMRRPTPGMERVDFKTTDGATWSGEARHAGVVWSRNGKHEQSPPDITNRVWQRTTMVLDPQKKEGSPQYEGIERIGGEPCRHYHFTNANSGEPNDVWVSSQDGRLVRWKAGGSTLELH